jgi:hypothetical protein
MRKSEAEALFYKTFKEYHPEWKLVKSKAIAHRKDTVTKDVIQFMMYDRLEGWVVNPVVYSYNFELEDLFKKIIGNSPAKYTELSFGSGMAKIDQTERYEGGSHASFDLGFDSLREFKYVYKKLDELYDRIEKKFFKEFRSLEAVDDILNTYPQRNTLYCNGIERFMKGVLVAWIVKNPRLNEVIEMYSKEVYDPYSIKDDQYIKDFEKIIDFCTK